MTDSDKLSGVLQKLKAGKKLTARERKLVDAAQRPATHFPTLDAVAEYYGVARPSLSQWQELFPDAFTKGPNGYDAQAIADARRRYIAQAKKVNLNKGDIANSEGGAGTDYGSLEQLKLRKEWLACEKTAVQIDILLGKFAPVDSVLEQVRTVFYAIKDKFRRIPKELAYEVSGKSPAEAEDIIADAVDRVLVALADHFEKLQETLSEPPEDGEVKQSRAPQARESFVTTGKNS